MDKVWAIILNEEGPPFVSALIYGSGAWDVNGMTQGNVVCAENIHGCYRMRHNPPYLVLTD